MRSPTVHLNGSAKQELTRQYLDMVEAVKAARKVLQSNGPHARDFYVQGPEAHTEAAQEHMNRMIKLGEIEEELMGIAKSVMKQR